MLYKAVGESTRFAVSGAVAATLLVRRDAETLTWVAGAILAAVCNKILKRIIKEDRPEAGDDGGMPSSHACSVCHLGVGAALRFPPDEAPARRPGRVRRDVARVARDEPLPHGAPGPRGRRVRRRDGRGLSAGSRETVRGGGAARADPARVDLGHLTARAPSSSAPSSAPSG